MSDSETAAESAVQDTPAMSAEQPESPQPPSDNGVVEHVKSEQHVQESHTIHKTTTVTTHTMNHQHFQEDFVQEQATMIQKWPPLPRDATVVGVKDVDVTLSKEEGQSWGFRIGGGKEYGTPLCIIRVQLGSIAEKQGIQVGDVVNSINGVVSTELTHNDAHEAIKKAGNKCLISLTRNIAAKGKIPRPFQTMAPLKDLTTIQPPDTPNSRSMVAPPVAAKATMRGVTLGQRELDAELAELTFTEEVIAETMSSHAEIVVGNALGVNFHKFEPQYEHLAVSSVYQMLLEEESKRGRTMNLPRGPRKPEIIPRKQERGPPPPPKEPTPPPKEPTPPPKEPTPPPKESTPPPKETTPPPKELTPPPPEEVSEDLEKNLQPGPEPQYLDAEAPLTNGVNGDASQASAYYQQHHELTRKQQELLQSQIKQKMQFEECRKRINKAQRIMYTPTPQAEEIVVEDCVTGLERKLPKAGSRYRPSLPLTCAASLHQAFPTKPETFEPFQAKVPPVFQPNVAPGDKPLAKPACAVQCKIPMDWHPPSKLINGQPYKSQHTVCNLGRPQPSQEFLPPADPEEPREPQRPVAHPLLPVQQPELPKHVPSEQLTEDDIAEMISANAEVIVGQTLGVNFQKFMPGFDHLQNSAVYRMVHGLEE